MNGLPIPRGLIRLIGYGDENEEEDEIEEVVDDWGEKSGGILQLMDEGNGAFERDDRCSHPRDLPQHEQHRGRR